MNTTGCGEAYVGVGDVDAVHWLFVNGISRNISGEGPG